MEFSLRHVWNYIYWEILYKFTEVILNFFNTDVDRFLKFVEPSLFFKFLTWVLEFRFGLLNEIVLICDAWS